MAEWSLKEVVYVLLALIVTFAALQAVGRGCSLYMSDKNKAQATGTLETFSNFLDSIKEGQQDNFSLYAPVGYYFRTFDAQHSYLSQCYNQNCACICKDEGCQNKDSWCRLLSVSPGNFNATKVIAFPDSEMIIAKRTASGFVLTSSLKNEPIAPSVAVPGITPVNIPVR